jgi:antibiotic biosynthesis monooxygenase (ABM) superfamily enzyme
VFIHEGGNAAAIFLGFGRQTEIHTECLTTNLGGSLLTQRAPKEKQRRDLTATQIRCPRRKSQPRLYRSRFRWQDRSPDGRSRSDTSGMNEENKGPAPPAAVVITMRLRPGVEQEFSSWHAKISTAAAGCAGFISAEVSAAVMSDQQQWQIIQHFRDADSLHAWRQSEPYRDLLLKADSLVDWLDSNGLRVEEATGDQADGPVTEVFTTRVKPDKVGDYQEWAARIHKAEAQFPGYRGGYLQPPVSANQPYWTSLVRFATAEQLDKWLNSDERRELLRDHDALVSSWESHHLPSAFAGWFPADQASGASPPAWKESMVVMLVLSRS